MKQRLAASYAISLLVIFLVVLNAPASTLINSVGTGTLRNDYNGTVGYEFTVGSTPLYVSELGYFDNNNDGLNTAHNVGLWNSFGELVATATVSAGTGATLSGGFQIGRAHV